MLHNTRSPTHSVFTYPQSPTRPGLSTRGPTVAFHCHRVLKDWPCSIRRTRFTSHTHAGCAPPAGAYINMFFVSKNEMNALGYCHPGNGRTQASSLPTSTHKVQHTGSQRNQDTQCAPPRYQCADRSPCPYTSAGRARTARNGSSRRRPRRRRA